MKTSIFLTVALLSGVTAITATPAGAVVYCDYIGVPQGCVARPGVALRAAPGAGAPGVGVLPGAGAPGVGVAPGAGAGAAGPGLSPGTPANRGGPVNRAGPR
jgi:hypothetical protein